MFSTLRAGYNSLQASTQPQSATSTIDKLCERLVHSQQREDRRAALLALKGLSRDWKTVSPSPATATPAVKPCTCEVGRPSDASSSTDSLAAWNGVQTQCRDTS